jgi:putative ABC transport system permease protein
MLFRNVLRTLKSQWVQLILLGIIITLSSFIYSTMTYSMEGVIDPTNEYFTEANQETSRLISWIDY